MTANGDGREGRTDARGANFRSAILTGANMREVDLRGAKLQGADMQRVQFEGALLEGAELLEDDFSDYWLKAPALIEEWLRQNLEAGAVGDAEMRDLLERLERAMAANRGASKGGFWAKVMRRDPDGDYRNVIHRMEAYLDMLAAAGVEQ